jgi:hypothetical protein
VGAKKTRFAGSVEARDLEGESEVANIVGLESALEHADGVVLCCDIAEGLWTAGGVRHCVDTREAGFSLFLNPRYQSSGVLVYCRDGFLLCLGGSIASRLEIEERSHCWVVEEKRLGGGGGGMDNETRSAFAFITLASRLAKHHRSGPSPSPHL